MALAQAGYKTPTPIQAQAIPPIVNGSDLLGIAQTGTGKTAAFALPILEELHRKPVRPIPGRPRVLVLTPTRELASQIEASFRTYGRQMKVATAVIFGGVGQHPQVQALRRGMDVIIATPGRLLDLMEQRHCHLDKVDIFVLDEADRMLDMGFIRDIRKIVSALPQQRQTLLFSATMPTEIAELAHEQLKDPVRVEVTPQSTTVERIDQKLLFVDKSRKRDLLRHCLADNSIFQALVFTRTKRGADKVAEDLEKNGIHAAAIHGNKAQNHRERTLRAFRNGSLRVLVATDIAARGLDIPGVSHVFNYELPDEPESYVHRIGRTARAGRDGQALAFCSREELENLRDIEKTINMLIEVDSSHPFHENIQRLAPRGQGKSQSPLRDYKYPRQQSQKGQGGHSHQSRNRPSTGSSQARHRDDRQGGFRDEGRGGSRDGFRNESRHAAPGGERGFEERQQRRDLRNDQGERRGPREDRPSSAHSQSRPQEWKPRNDGSRHDGPRSHSNSPGQGQGGGRRRGPSTGSGQARHQGKGGPGAGNSNKGIGGIFKAIKRKFGG
jgi:ATP-dependent RNA helicase RhlE